MSMKLFNGDPAQYDSRPASASASAFSSRCSSSRAIVVAYRRSPECPRTGHGIARRCADGVAAIESAFRKRRQDHRSRLTPSRDARYSAAQNAFRQIWMGRARCAAPHERSSGPDGERSRDSSPSIYNKLSAMEVAYAHAHRLMRSRPRRRSARRAATCWRVAADDLLNNIEQLGVIKTQKVIAARIALAE